MTTGTKQGQFDKGNNWQSLWMVHSTGLSYAITAPLLKSKVSFGNEKESFKNVRYVGPTSSIASRTRIMAHLACFSEPCLRRSSRDLPIHTNVLNPSAWLECRREWVYHTQRLSTLLIIALDVVPTSERHPPPLKFWGFGSLEWEIPSTQNNETLPFIRSQSPRIICRRLMHEKQGARNDYGPHSTPTCLLRLTFWCIQIVQRWEPVRFIVF